MKGLRGEVGRLDGRFLTRATIGPTGRGPVLEGNKKMSMTMNLVNGCSMHHGVLTISPRGPRLTDREASRLASQVGTFMKTNGRKVRRLEIDLSEVYTMSITALGMCLEFERLAKEWKAELVLHDVSDPIRDVLRLLRLDRLLGGKPRPRAWSARRRRIA